jgi:hypothetical protein
VKAEAGWIGGRGWMGAMGIALTAISLSAAPARQTFTGVITDDMCPKGDHSQMQMGPTAADCARACVDIHGAQYVLYDGKTAYVLSDQKTSDKFAGQKVRVTGALDAKTKKITVDSIAAAK